MSIEYGVTENGFVAKTLQIIDAEIDAALKAALGAGLNTQPQSVFGQLKSIIAERESLLWELAEDVYNNAYAASASGVSLDNVCELTATVRDPASNSNVDVLCFGTPTTVVPVGTRFSVSGNPTAIFETLANATIGAVQNAIQTITFENVPDAGTWTITFDGQTTAAMAFNDNAAAIEAALELLSNINDVTVAGDYTNGFTVEWVTADAGIDRALMTAASSLTYLTNPVPVIIANTQFGGSNISVECDAVNTGQVIAYAGTLTVIDTPVAGLTSVRNPLDADLGSAIETDPSLRLKRLEEIHTSNAGTLESMRTVLLNVDDVEAVAAFENTTMFVDGDGRPPKSVHMVVDGGDDDDIGEAIWNSKPGGIETFGAQTVNVEDSLGTLHAINFDRPTPINIYLDVALTVNSNYPVNGDDQVLQAILIYGDTLSIGDDVVVFGSDALVNAIGSIAGITDIVIDIGTAPAPSGDANVVIGATEKSDWDSTRIGITS